MGLHLDGPRPVCAGHLARFVFGAFELERRHPIIVFFLLSTHLIDMSALDCGYGTHQPELKVRNPEHFCLTVASKALAVVDVRLKDL